MKMVEAYGYGLAAVAAASAFAYCLGWMPDNWFLFSLCCSALLYFIVYLSEEDI